MLTIQIVSLCAEYLPHLQYSEVNVDPDFEDSVKFLNQNLLFAAMKCLTWSLIGILNLQD